MSVEGLNLTHLTETERDAIMEVIHRDENLQKADDSRVRKLRAEINQIRMKGVIKPGIDPNRTCARCREPLGLLFNRGDLCHKCHSKVCNKCKVNEKDNTWLCVLCSKQQELEIMSGGWFYSKFRKSKRHRKTNKVISGSEIIRASIKHPSLGYCNKRTATTDVKMALMHNTPPRHLMNNHSYTDTDSSGSQEGTRAKRKNKIPTGENVMSPNVSDELRLKQLVGTKPAYTRSGREPIQVRRVQGRPPFVTESSSSSDEEYEKSVPYKVNHVTPSAERNTNQQKTANHRKVYPSDTELNSPQSSATESTHNNKHFSSQEANYLHTAAATYSSVDSQQSDSYHSGKLSSSNQSSIESASGVSEAFRLHQNGGRDPRNRRLASDSSSRQTSVESHSSGHNGASSPMRARSPQPIDANVIISKPKPVEEDPIMPVVASRSREIDVEKLNSLEYSSSNDDSEFTSRHNRRNRHDPEHKSNPAAIHRTNGENNQDMTPNRVRKKGLGYKQVTYANRTQNGIKQNGTARMGVKDEPNGVQGEEDVIVEELSQVKFRRCSSHKTVKTRQWSGAVNGETTTPIINDQSESDQSSDFEGDDYGVQDNHQGPGLSPQIGGMTGGGSMEPSEPCLHANSQTVPHLHSINSHSQSGESSDTSSKATIVGSDGGIGHDVGDGHSNIGLVSPRFEGSVDSVEGLHTSLKSPGSESEKMTKSVNFPEELIEYIEGSSSDEEYPGRSHDDDNDDFDNDLSPRESALLKAAVKEALKANVMLEGHNLPTEESYINISTPRKSFEESASPAGSVEDDLGYLKSKLEGDIEYQSTPLSSSAHYHALPVRRRNSDEISDCLSVIPEENESSYDFSRRTSAVSARLSANSLDMAAKESPSNEVSHAFPQELSYEEKSDLLATKYSDEGSPDIGLERIHINDNSYLNITQYKVPPKKPPRLKEALAKADKEKQADDTDTSESKSESNSFVKHADVLKDNSDTTKMGDGFLIKGPSKTVSPHTPENQVTSPVKKQDTLTRMAVACSVTDHETDFMDVYASNVQYAESSFESDEAEMNSYTSKTDVPKLEVSQAEQIPFSDAKSVGPSGNSVCDTRHPACLQGKEDVKASGELQQMSSVTDLSQNSAIHSNLDKYNANGVVVMRQKSFESTTGSTHVEPLSRNNSTSSENVKSEYVVQMRCKAADGRSRLTSKESLSRTSSTSSADKRSGVLFDRHSTESGEVMDDDARLSVTSLKEMFEVKPKPMYTLQKNDNDETNVEKPSQANFHQSPAFARKNGSEPIQVADLIKQEEPSEKSDKSGQISHDVKNEELQRRVKPLHCTSTDVPTTVKLKTSMGESEKSTYETEGRASHLHQGEFDSNVLKANIEDPDECHMSQSPLLTRSSAGSLGSPGMSLDSSVDLDDLVDYNEALVTDSEGKTHQTLTRTVTIDSIMPYTLEGNDSESKKHKPLQRKVTIDSILPNSGDKKERINKINEEIERRNSSKPSKVVASGKEYDEFKKELCATNLCIADEEEIVRGDADGITDNLAKSEIQMVGSTNLHAFEDDTLTPYSRPSSENLGYSIEQKQKDAEANYQGDHEIGSELEDHRSPGEVSFGRVETPGGHNGSESVVDQLQGLVGRISLGDSHDELKKQLLAMLSQLNNECQMETDKDADAHPRRDGQDVVTSTQDDQEMSIDAEESVLRRKKKAPKLPRQRKHISQDTVEKWEESQPMSGEQGQHAFNSEGMTLTTDVTDGYNNQVVENRGRDISVKMKNLEKRKLDFEEYEKPSVRSDEHESPKENVDTIRITSSEGTKEANRLMAASLDYSVISIETKNDLVPGSDSDLTAQMTQSDPSSPDNVPKSNDDDLDLCAYNLSSASPSIASVASTCKFLPPNQSTPMMEIGPAVVTPEEEADQREAADNVSRSSVSNGMSPENTLTRRGRARKHVTVKDPRDQEVYDANPEPVVEQPPVQEPPVQEPPPKPKRSPDRASVELPAVTVASNKETGEDLDEQLAAEEEDSIDDLVENHRRSFASHDSHGSNLLSPFSDSRESITSFYSDAGEGNYGKIPVTGEIQFSLDYVYKTGLFEVRIKQCKDLAPVDTKRNRSDPYVKTYLLPDKSRSGKRKTRVKKHTLNPTFDEALRYAVAESELRSRTLWVTVWHNDTFGRNDFLGEVTIPLDYHKFGDNSPRWYPLKERNPVPASLLTYKGDLIVSLKFVTPDQVVSKNKTSKGALYVVIKEARNLTAVRTNGSSDPFCKGYLLPDKSKNAKQKTPVMKKDCNPKWDHTFSFEDVTQAELKARSLELTIWDHDRFTSNDFLGGVRLNLGTGLDQGNSVEWMDARGEEISIWQSMLDRPNCWIDGTLLLRTNMDQRK